MRRPALVRYRPRPAVLTASRRPWLGAGSLLALGASRPRARPGPAPSCPLTIASCAAWQLLRLGTGCRLAARVVGLEARRRPSGRRPPPHVELAFPRFLLSHPDHEGLFFRLEPHDRDYPSGPRSTPACAAVLAVSPLARGGSRGRRWIAFALVAFLALGRHNPQSGAERCAGPRRLVSREFTILAWRRWGWPRPGLTGSSARGKGPPRARRSRSRSPVLLLPRVYRSALPYARWLTGSARPGARLTPKRCGRDRHPRERLGGHVNARPWPRSWPLPWAGRRPAAHRDRTRAPGCRPLALRPAGEVVPPRLPGPPRCGCLPGPAVRPERRSEPDFVAAPGRPLPGSPRPSTGPA